VLCFLRPNKAMQGGTRPRIQWGESHPLRHSFILGEIRRADLIAYCSYLFDAGKASVTALNKLMRVTTWLKQNTAVTITRLSRAEDWPTKPDTEPRPYSVAEQSEMIDAAYGPKQKLLLRLFLGSGMREQEIAHSELSDIKGNYIQVQAKPRWGWSPKTDAGTRRIPLGDALRFQNALFLLRRIKFSCEFQVMPKHRANLA
jgi:hypothetical protein